ncbi:MAG TPA: DsbA family protein [Nitrospira sp.]|nr:DsbA family protein [Nitrospira sp.]
MSEAQAQRVVLYSDFNCPFCYAMHEQLRESGLGGRVEWRGVQHAPHLPVPMAAWNGALAAELRHEVALVGRLAPALPIAVPRGKPNTRAAIFTAARVLSRDPRQGEELVRALYVAFWRDGVDLSDPALLGNFAGVTEEDVLNAPAEMAQTVEQWDDEWRQTGQCGVPLLVGPEGEQLVGFVWAPEVVRFIRQT